MPTSRMRYHTINILTRIPLKMRWRERFNFINPFACYKVRNRALWVQDTMNALTLVPMFERQVLIPFCH